ncbi:MAG: AIR synthase related protein [Candidatus Jorgensenbacteria bacterium]|nr:AIR synthase related protein [Candidatus Jorgensenbacteria bacterium]
MQIKNTITYLSSGVDYGAMDPFKCAAQLAAKETAQNLELYHGLIEIGKSRGESAYIMEFPGFYLAHVHEGLGTKNLVADEMGKDFPLFYDAIAQDTVAMIVNDVITVGALPISVAMHLAVGSSNWFKETERSSNLIAGWKKTCDMAQCAWGGGKTPTLQGIIEPGTVELSGSAIGIISPKKNILLGEKLQAGDAIVLFGSSGIHANGLTLARKIGKKLVDGFRTKISDGRTYGEALLDPTIIYVPLMRNLQKAGIEIHYAVNITGHGWRKIMREPQEFTYIIEKIPKPQPIFKFIQENGPVSDEEAYANLNMGAGLALFMPEKYVSETILIANLQCGISALPAGHVARGKKKVVIRPLGIEYSAETLRVR